MQLRNLPILLGLLTWLTTFPAFAHEGPPFPILLDKPAGEFVVSVWADPDIGEAQFFIIVETKDGQAPAEEPAVSMWAQPISGRLDRVDYTSERQPLRNRMQFECKPHFDQRDFWTVGFQIAGKSGTVEELTVEIESTPPGYGAWDLLIYLFPFALLGGLWIIAMVRNVKRRRKQFAAQRAEAHDPAKPPTGTVGEQSENPPKRPPA